MKLYNIVMHVGKADVFLTSVATGKESLYVFGDRPVKLPLPDDGDICAVVRRVSEIPDCVELRAVEDVF